jgi:hypothetical protein
MERSQFQAWAEAIRGHWLGAAVLASMISLIVSGSWHHLVPTKCRFVAADQHSQSPADAHRPSGELGVDV